MMSEEQTNIIFGLLVAIFIMNLVTLAVVLSISLKLMPK